MDERKVHPSEFLELNTSHLTDLTPSHTGALQHDSSVSDATSTSTPTAAAAAAATATTTVTDGKTATTLHHAEFARSARSSDASFHLDQGTIDATRREHRMTFAEGFKLWPKAVGWSMLISLAIIMEGFDTALINSFYAFVQFRRAYGVPAPGGSGYQITAPWQTALANASAGGAILGLFANGILTDRYGYRRTMIGSLLGLAACIFLTFFAVSIQMLLAGQVLSGISWGIFSTLTTTYAAEVVPLNLRGYLTANVNMCWLIGQVIAVGSLRGLIDLKSNWSYRIPFGLQWVWIVLLLTIAFLAPESPWWLVRHKRLDEAERVLLRLTRRGFNYDAKSTVAIMDYTNRTEQRLNNTDENGGISARRDVSYLQCFRGTNLRRTEIVCCIFAIQNLSGLPVIAFAAYFYNRLGFTQRRSFDLTLALQAVAILGALVSILLMKIFNRRTLYLWGLVAQFLVLLAAGIASTFPETTTTLWITASLVLLFIFVFDCAIGPLTYCIVAEIPSTRLRVKSVALARVSYNVCALITNPIQTRMLNPLDWNWRGKSCYFWAGACALCWLYCWFRLPDTKGLTYLELDLLFEKKARATRFEEFRKNLERSGYFGFRDWESWETRWTDEVGGGGGGGGETGNGRGQAGREGPHCK